MFFKDHYNYPDASIDPHLLWEYNANNIDFEKMLSVIVQRVVERGWPNDRYATLNLSGIDGVLQAIKKLPYLSDKDMNFVGTQFKIPLTSLTC